jgi:hypothetical protein
MHTQRALCLLVLAAPVLLTGAPAFSQQVEDTTFSPSVSAPAHPAGAGPLILVDEGHRNFHTVDGRYRAFARLLRADGYVVKAHAGRFTAESLRGARILVIANALAPENAEAWHLPTPSAFDSAEIAAVRSWVQTGGSLWLIADHMPFPGAAGDLAAAFGILMSNGFAMDASGDGGRMRFARVEGTLADHPVTRGRTRGEQVDSVISFTGQAFRLAPAGEPLMTLARGTRLLLPQVAWQFSALTPEVPASGMLQGAVLRSGRGRIAVFGEAAMFTAQVSGPQRVPSGMNDPAAKQNPQFLLNVVHWLDGSL